MRVRCASSDDGVRHDAPGVLRLSRVGRRDDRGARAVTSAGPPDHPLRHAAANRRLERASGARISSCIVAAAEIAITPLTRRLTAAIRVPGSKSITNRALLLAALAYGRSVIDGVLISDDTRRMAAALVALGFTVEVDEAARQIAVFGRGGAIPASEANLDAGGAGTAMRFLAGFLTLGRGRYRLDGNARMCERPIGDLIDALCSLGLPIHSEMGNRCPPVVIEADKTFEGGVTRIDASLSSQFVSALLIPSPLWPR